MGIQEKRDRVGERGRDAVKGGNEKVLLLECAACSKNYFSETARSYPPEYR